MRWELSIQEKKPTKNSWFREKPDSVRNRIPRETGFRENPDFVKNRKFVKDLISRKPNFEKTGFREKPNFKKTQAATPYQLLALRPDSKIGGNADGVGGNGT
jgi:hypothetical protein